MPGCREAINGGSGFQLFLAVADSTISDRASPETVGTGEIGGRGRFLFFLAGPEYGSDQAQQLLVA